MRRPVLAALALLMLLTALPAAAAAAPPVACDDEGRERFTMQGLDLQMPAPAVTSQGVALGADPTNGLHTSHRSAPFHFVADFAPAAAATVAATLEWENPSDFDLYVYDAAGNSLAASDAYNIEEESTSETLELDLDHCTLFTLVVRNWTGNPNETLSLQATVTPHSTLLACAADDPAPNCAGKAAGEAPDATPADTRTRLYLGGDPGQVSMVHGYAAQTSAVPFRGTLGEGRPMSGTPNQYTRPVVGFREQYANPFVPHFTTRFEQPRDLTSDVEALLWISSPTLKDGGTLFVDLYADGGLVTQVQIPGAQVPETPAAPMAIRLPIAPDQAVTGITSLTLQLGTTPAISTAGEGNRADALFTVHYGGTQFPSRLTLQ